MGFHTDTSIYTFPLQDRFPTYITLRDSGGYFHKKLLNLTQIIILFFTRLYFASGLKTDFQPASSQRTTLHLDLWVTDLSMHLPRIPRHVKGSKYHTLIDSESYFLPSHSLRVSMLCLTNWGGLGAESQESLCRRPCFFFWAPRSQGVNRFSAAKCIRATLIWARYGYHLLKGSWLFRFDKNRETF